MKLKKIYFIIYINNNNNYSVIFLISNQNCFYMQTFRQFKFNDINSKDKNSVMKKKTMKILFTWLIFYCYFVDQINYTQISLGDSASESFILIVQKKYLIQKYEIEMSIFKTCLRVFFLINKKYAKISHLDKKN